MDLNNLQKNISYYQLSKTWDTNFEDFASQILGIRPPNITSLQKTENFSSYNTNFFLFSKWPIQYSDESKS